LCLAFETLIFDSPEHTYAVAFLQAHRQTASSLSCTWEFSSEGMEGREEGGWVYLIASRVAHDIGVAHEVKHQRVGVHFGRRLEGHLHRHLLPLHRKLLHAKQEVCSPHC